MIRFACPGCSATFTVADDKAGKTGKCPKCQTQFTIPQAAVEEAVIPPPRLSVEPPPPMTSVEPPPPAPPPVEPPPPMPPPVEAPPPVAPSPPGPNDPVEIVPCPKCSSRLSVLPGDLGLDVECPTCQTVYKALRADAPPPPTLESKTRSSSLVKYGSGAKGKPDDDDEDDDRPSRRKKGRRDDDDDDDEEDRPRRRRRSRSVSRRSNRNYEPHRGTLILVLAIVSWVSGVFILGIVSWVLGAADMKSIDSGRMDPEGRTTTQIGMYLGMAHAILVIVLILGYCVLAGCFFGIFAGAAGGAGGR